MIGRKKPSKYREKYVNNNPDYSSSTTDAPKRQKVKKKQDTERSRSTSAKRKPQTAGSNGTSTRKRRKKKKKEPFFKRFFRMVRRLLLMIVLLVAISAGYLVHQANELLNAVNPTPLDDSQLVTVDNDENMKNYTNIALFGVDTREEDLSEKTRSDSIIVVSINNKTHDVKMTSIYRDTYCSINGTYSKITHAYAYGGPEMAISTINRNFDLNISQYATVNFKIMADIINALGGLQLTVESDFIDDLNKYIKETNKLNGGNSATFDSAGTYTLDGNQAVAYARIRHNQDGDYSRASRQRIVLKALAQKMKAHPIKSLQALQDVIPRVQTNLTKSDLTKLALHITQYNFDTNEGIPYKDDLVETRVNGMCVEVPSTLEENVVKLHKQLFNTDNYEISTELSKINQKIMNQTGCYN